MSKTPDITFHISMCSILWDTGTWRIDFLMLRVPQSLSTCISQKNYDRVSVQQALCLTIFIVLPHSGHTLKTADMKTRPCSDKETNFQQETVRQVSSLHIFQ